LIDSSGLGSIEKRTMEVPKGKDNNRTRPIEHHRGNYSKKKVRELTSDLWKRLKGEVDK